MIGFVGDLSHPVNGFPVVMLLNGDVGLVDTEGNFRRKLDRERSEIFLLALHIRRF